MKAKDVKIGLEIHIQLNTRSKLFCSCSAHWLERENTHICPICTGQPGAKPAGVNKKAIIQALKAAYLLHAEIKREVIFQRKHYFYPDLPSNYQRTSTPIATKGKIGQVTIEEMHIEEDPGRYHLKEGLVDYNRSGIPLIEIVTAPDISSPEEAKAFLTRLRDLLIYADIMREGQESVVRADVNVSIAGGERVEIKNVNSFSNVVEAIKSEIKRQENLLAQGLRVERETRHFDESSGATFRLRRKETADDYRYIPDPDILPLQICEEWIKQAKESVGEHPDIRLKKMVEKYGLAQQDAKRLMSEKELADAFEELAKKLPAEKSAHFLLTILRKQLNYRNLMFRQSGLSAKALSEALGLFLKGEISDDGLESIVITMLDEQKHDVERIVEEKHLLIIKDEKELETLVKQVIESERKAVADLKQGQDKALFYLVGKVMRLTHGRADPKKVGALIKQVIYHGEN